MKLLEIYNSSPKSSTNVLAQALQQKPNAEKALRSIDEQLFGLGYRALAHFPHAEGFALSARGLDGARHLLRIHPGEVDFEAAPALVMRPEDQISLDNTDIKLQVFALPETTRTTLYDHAAAHLLIAQEETHAWQTVNDRYLLRVGGKLAAAVLPGLDKFQSRNDAGLWHFDRAATLIAEQLSFADDMLPMAHQNFLLLARAKMPDTVLKTLAADNSLHVHHSRINLVTTPYDMLDFRIVFDPAQEMSGRAIAAALRITPNPMPELRDSMQQQARQPYHRQGQYQTLGL